MAKYTDEQTKQALKCCGEDGCEECPMNFTSDDIGCELYVGQLYLLALDLINRQEAEIERWREESENQGVLWSKHFASIFENAKEGVRAEAIKDFAERLKTIYNGDNRYDRPNAHTLIVKLFANIDNLVKEMVGESNV